MPNRSRVVPNPETHCPSDILEQQAAATIEHVDFSGVVRTGVIEVNVAVLPDVIDFFEHALLIKFPVERVAAASDPDFGWDDNRIMEANASSGFNFRYITGSTTNISLHGLGRAFDINPVQNPYLNFSHTPTLILPPGASWNTQAPGTLYRDHELVQLMLERGWEWGGDWTQESGRIDYQHFQKPE